jgi:DNA-binding CsgD family transcriptional regulator
LETAADAVQFWRVMGRNIRALGFERYVYLLKDETGRVHVHTDLDPEYYGPAEVDPFLQWCCDSHEMVLTGPEFAQSYDFLCPTERDFIERASRSGMRSGLGVPVLLRRRHRFGGFNLLSSFSRERFEKRLSPMREQARALCLLAQQRIEDLKVTEDGGADLHSELTPRERDIFDLWSHGLTRAQIAYRLDISPQTVATHVKAAYRKLGISSQAQAIRLVQERSA